MAAMSGFSASARRIMATISSPNFSKSTERQLDVVRKQHENLTQEYSSLVDDGDLQELVKKNPDIAEAFKGLTFTFDQVGASFLDGNERVENKQASDDDDITELLFDSLVRGDTP